jgi:hypothetical protein
VLLFLLRRVWPLYLGCGAAGAEAAAAGHPDSSGEAAAPIYDMLLVNDVVKIVAVHVPALCILL